MISSASIGPELRIAVLTVVLYSYNYRVKRKRHLCNVKVTPIPPIDLTNFQFKTIPNTFSRDTKFFPLLFSSHKVVFCTNDRQESNYQNPCITQVGDFLQDTVLYTLANHLVNTERLLLNVNSDSRKRNYDTFYTPLTCVGNVNLLHLLHDQSSTYDSESGAIARHLASFDLMIDPVKADGDCAFRSIIRTVYYMKDAKLQMQHQARKRPEVCPIHIAGQKIRKTLSAIPTVWLLGKQYRRSGNQGMFGHSENCCIRHIVIRVHACSTIYTSVMEERASFSVPASPSVQASGLTTKQGCLVIALKNGVDKVMTNFFPECIGYITKNALMEKAMGFLIKVTQKESEMLSNSAEETTPQQDNERTPEHEVFFLTWKDMSSQFSIMEKLNLKHLWTQPSKEQFLPAYFKSIYDEYRAMPSAKQCVLVLEHGLQAHSNPPTWVYMSDSGEWQRPKPLIIQLQEGNRVQLIKEEEAGYTILDTKLPILAISKNYGGFLLALGGLAMAFNLEKLAYKAKINIPALLVIGSPVSCKNLTCAGLLRCVAENPLPKHWEDVSDLETFERIAKTLIIRLQNMSNSIVAPRTTLVMTANMDFINKVTADPQKAKRLFARVVAIPFTGIVAKSSYTEGLKFEKQFRKAINPATKCLPEIIKLHSLSGEDQIHGTPRHVHGTPRFVNAKIFKTIYDYLHAKSSTMTYWDGTKTTQRESSYATRLDNILSSTEIEGSLLDYAAARPGPSRKLCLQQEFLLVLMKLRLGSMQADLAFRFKISIGKVSQIFITWIKLQRA
eukprot:gene1671-1861_t